mgnify:CR=1 FL=1
MDYELIDKLMPQKVQNPPELNEKIESFMSANPGIDENDLNELLALCETVGFARGVKIGLKLSEEVNTN